MSDPSGYDEVDTCFKSVIKVFNKEVENAAGHGKIGATIFDIRWVAFNKLGRKAQPLFALFLDKRFPQWKGIPVQEKLRRISVSYPLFNLYKNFALREAGRRKRIYIVKPERVDRQCEVHELRRATGKAVVASMDGIVYLCGGCKTKLTKAVNAGEVGGMISKSEILSYLKKCEEKKRPKRKDRDKKRIREATIYQQ